MRKLSVSFLLLLAFCSCQYRWGEGLGSLKGEYSVGKIRNLSEYNTAGTTLEQKLLDGLRRQSRVTFGNTLDNATLIEGTITKIEKLDLEQDELGRPKEWQFLITMDLRCSSRHGADQITVLSNRDNMKTSGIYRPLDNHAQNDFARQTVREDEALTQALDDLVQRIMLYLSTHPQ